jgi:hypothetical protein
VSIGSPQIKRVRLGNGSGGEETGSSRSSMQPASRSCEIADYERRLRSTTTSLRPALSSFGRSVRIDRSPFWCGRSCPTSTMRAMSADLENSTSTDGAANHVADADIQPAPGRDTAAGRLDGKVALITGAATGLGSGWCRTFRRRGCVGGRRRRGRSHVHGGRHRGRRRQGDRRVLRRHRRRRRPCGRRRGRGTLRQARRDVQQRRYLDGRRRRAHQHTPRGVGAHPAGQRDRRGRVLLGRHPRRCSGRAAGRSSTSPASSPIWVPPHPADRPIPPPRAPCCR